MFPESSRAALVKKLADSFKSSAIELFTANGIERFDFSVAAPNVAQLLIDFYNVYNRFPALIFNDGIPPALKSEFVYPDRYGIKANDIVRWDVDADGFGWPVLNVKFKTVDNLQKRVLVGQTDAGEPRELRDVSGYYNGRPNTNYVYPRIENSEIDAGAFQTWGVLLLCLSYPEYCYASDNGILIKPAGISILENSLAYWINIYGNYGMDDYIPRGPYVVGMPIALLNSLRTFMDTMRAKRDNGLITFAGMFLSFVGFYFGASAFSGLIGGAFTIPNLQGTINLASKFGVETGNAGQVLKLVDSAGFSPDTMLTTAGTHAMEDYDFWAEIGIDPASMATFEPASADWMNDFWVNAGLEDFVTGLDALANVGFDAVQIGIENDAALLEAVATTTGPLSVAQIAQTAQVKPAVAAAASTAMKQSGGNPASVSANPQQAQAAANLAAQKAAAARSMGDTANGSIWETAGKLLNTYAQYQLKEKEIEARYGQTALPRQTTYPNNSGVARQPDGSITVRNPDGSFSTVRPNGQVQHTGAGMSLPDFFSTRNLLIVGGVTAVGAVVYLLANKGK